ncbi:hypothetical protein [Dactylosporangium darangshiense]|uniref:hypothetical protein n=1 Tax=Dactylosporangium darangshiense TaxID=579108 RepID=UPI003632B2C7
MSGTLNGNPLGCVAGLAAVNVMHEIDGCGIITDLGERLQAGLSGVFTDAGIAAAPIGVPAFTDVVFGRSEVHNYRDYIDSDRQAAIDFGSRMLAMGFLIRPGSKIYLSAVHTSAHIESFVSAAAEVTEQMRGEGLLAEAPTRVPRTPARRTTRASPVPDGSDLSRRRPAMGRRIHRAIAPAGPRCLGLLTDCLWEDT